MSFDENVAIIEPRKGKREGALPPLCILVFSPEDLARFVPFFSPCDKSPHKLYFADVYIGTYEGVSVVLAGPMLGAPQTVLVLEKLIALGVSKVVGVGWCGSLQSRIRIGDVVLPSSSIAEEGTSAHYPISTDQPGPAEELLHPLRKIYEEAGLICHEGRIWTTDAPYRETLGKVLTYQKQGVMAVEMETSALFTVAHFRNIRLAMALVVSDDLSSLRWRHGFRDERFLEIRTKLPELTLKALCIQNGG